MLFHLLFFLGVFLPSLLCINAIVSIVDKNNSFAIMKGQMFHYNLLINFLSISFVMLFCLKTIFFVGNENRNQAKKITQ